METFSGRIAVVTGGGTGMGRALVVALAREGCHVATCDVFADTLAETAALARQVARDGARVVTYVADVAKELELEAFRADIVTSLSTNVIHLLFNNAGISGGGSFLDDERSRWEQTFNVDWGGVYLSTRVFMELLRASDEGHLINTSSVNGLWASLGPTIPHTAYSAAKFAVRGFTEALITDFRNNAPHLHAHVVMPGHIGTSIALNSGRFLGTDPDSLTTEDLDRLRHRLAARGMSVDGVSDEDVRKGITMMGERFRDSAPMTADQAAKVILDGVRNNQWRILVGDDAVRLDELVRSDPNGAYESEFFQRLRSNGVFDGVGN